MIETPEHDISRQAEKLALEIMNVSRNTLLFNFRFLDSALYQLPFEPAPDATLETDGRRLYYGLRHVLQSYKEDRGKIAHEMLHTILHCVFQHMTVGLVEQSLWDLACDIAVENVIDELNSQVNSVNTRRQAYMSALRTEVKRMTAEQIYRYFFDKNLSAEDIASQRSIFLADEHSQWYIAAGSENEVHEEFDIDLSKPDEMSPGEDVEDGEDGEDGKDGKDGEDGEDGEDGKGGEDGEDGEDGKGGEDGEDGEDGKGGEDGEDGKDGSTGKNGSTGKDSRTGKNGKPQTEVFRAALADMWRQIGERIQVDLETISKKQGLGAGGMMQNLKELNRERYDYTSFLKKFSVLGEEMQINDDEFDYIFYTYGLRLYENLPLIEPLEYKEVMRIREFVIAIDTSGSVAGELVQSFIRKTYNILMQSESFFEKVNIHIIQCDAAIQEDVKITSQEEFETYIKNMSLLGFGGTDFRPVFNFVDELIRKREFANLKGLLYLTDGYGTFPEQKPVYETAFVFVDDELSSPSIPVWAIKLVLSREDIDGYAREIY